MEFKTSLFDIAKFIGMGLLIAFVFFNYGKFTNWMNKPNTDPELIAKIEMLEAGLAKASGPTNTDELKKLIADLKKDNSIALEAINKANKKVDEITVVVTELKASSKIQSGDSHKDPDMPTRDFADTVVSRPDSKGEDLPMARVFYHPEIEDDPWTIQNFPLRLHTNVLQTEQEDGTYSNYIETYFTNDFVLSSKGKKYYFDSDIQWAKREIKDKKFSFNMRLGLTGNVSQESVFPGLDLSFFSYGRTKRDLDWRFLSLGLGYGDDKLYGYIIPFQYNIGNFIPLIENMYIGPMFGVSTESETIYGGSLSVLF
jgi:hypothetical protein